MRLYARRKYSVETAVVSNSLIPAAFSPKISPCESQLLSNQLYNVDRSFNDHIHYLLDLLSKEYSRAVTLGNNSNPVRSEAYLVFSLLKEPLMILRAN